MPGKQWSAAEEAYFWNHIIPRSKWRIKIARATNDEETFDQLAPVMQVAMGAKARRNYTGLGLEEHFYLNVKQRTRGSPFARPYTGPYKEAWGHVKPGVRSRRPTNRRVHVGGVAIGPGPAQNPGPPAPAQNDSVFQSPPMADGPSRMGSPTGPGPRPVLGAGVGPTTPSRHTTDLPFELRPRPVSHGAGYHEGYMDFQPQHSEYPGFDLSHGTAHHMGGAGREAPVQVHHYHPMTPPNPGFTVMRHLSPGPGNGFQEGQYFKEDGEILESRHPATRPGAEWDWDEGATTSTPATSVSQGTHTPTKDDDEYSEWDGIKDDESSHNNDDYDGLFVRQQVVASTDA